MSQNLIPSTPAGTRVKIMSSGRNGTTTGNQRDRSAGGMTRVAHEVRLDTGELRWATFCVILPEEVLELEAPQAEATEEAPVAPYSFAEVSEPMDIPARGLRRTCATCGEDMDSQWATAKCSAEGSVTTSTRVGAKVRIQKPVSGYGYGVVKAVDGPQKGHPIVIHYLDHDLDIHVAEKDPTITVIH